MVDRLNEGPIFVKIAPLDYEGLYNAIYCRFFSFFNFWYVTEFTRQLFEMASKYMWISSLF